jgi:hypothetical protein
MRGYLNISRFNDVFTPLKFNFESSERYITDESPPTISVRTPSIANEVEMTEFPLELPIAENFAISDFAYPDTFFCC